MYVSDHIHNLPTLQTNWQTDGRTDGRTNDILTAIQRYTHAPYRAYTCVSRGKNCGFGQHYRIIHITQQATVGFL